MLEKKYLRLQNGSDVRGIALDGVEGENVNLTSDIVYHIVGAFAHFVSEKYGKALEDIKIAVGHDSRLSATMLKEGALKGIQAQGCSAVDCSLSSTPSMFMSTILDGLCFDGAIMITASHLPFNRNGLKFFTKEGGLESKDIKVLLQKAIELEQNGIVENVKHEVVSCDLLKFYSANLRKIICKELGKSEDLITYVADRKGHDMRYAIDPTKIHSELGWLPETKFEDGIKKTIQWYLDNRQWWETIISGEYQNYYAKMYGEVI